VYDLQKFNQRRETYCYHEKKGGEKVMSEKNYDTIITLKRQGDYNTYYAHDVQGTLRDPSILFKTTSKDGNVTQCEVASSEVESISKVV